MFNDIKKRIWEDTFQVVDKLYILKIYKTNLKKVVERFLLLGDFW